MLKLTQNHVQIGQKRHASPSTPPPSRPAKRQTTSTLIKVPSFPISISSDEDKDEDDIQLITSKPKLRARSPALGPAFIFAMRDEHDTKEESATKERVQELLLHQGVHAGNVPKHVSTEVRVPRLDKAGLSRA